MKKILDQLVVKYFIKNIWNHLFTNTSDTEPHFICKPSWNTWVSLFPSILLQFNSSFYLKHLKPKTISINRRHIKCISSINRNISRRQTAFFLVYFTNFQKKNSPQKCITNICCKLIIKIKNVLINLKYVLVLFQNESNYKQNPDKNI